MFVSLNQKTLNLGILKNGLDGNELQQDCDNDSIRSINHGIDLQRLRKSTLSPFHEKKCYINQMESTHWFKTLDFG